MSHRGQLQCLNDHVSHHSQNMSPTSAQSPVVKLATPQRSASQDSTADGIRKRVCKACDRCRLKKSKCDGSHPCLRCKADNAICVFGERKKSHEKIYPKGYVEMLEQQQSKLVSGLQEMYKRMRAAQAWTDDELVEFNGQPLTHDILAALDLLEMKHDGSGEVETFEEDCAKLQSKLIARGTGFTQRRGSVSSDSDHSQVNARSVANATPPLSNPALFKEKFDFSAPPSPLPLERSPVHAPGLRQSFHTNQASPLQQSSPLSNDPQFYQAGWAYPEVTNAQLLARSKYAVQSLELSQNMVGMDDVSAYSPWDAPPPEYDAKFDFVLPAASYTQQFNPYGSLPRMQDGDIDPMALGPIEVEFNQFIQVHT